MDDLKRAESKASSGASSGFSQRLRSFSLNPIKRRPSRSPSALKNSYGLNTVFEPADPSTVIAEFVFVHGLGGGSSTTWSLTDDPTGFWPKKWLPDDPKFSNVRIHSFGYNASWATWHHNPLDVHAFGQSLVEELLNNPKVKGQRTLMVLIGHSMGGLVIKKACILSKTNPEFRDVAERLHSFYFLGTPHRGSDLAAVLNNILKVSGIGRRPVVTGLEVKSELIRVLNDQFRLHYHNIHLHTFYESQPMANLGLIIVDIESATLGYAEERPQLLNADHRNLTKFTDTDDSNYRSLRNRLAATVDQIISDPRVQSASSESPQTDASSPLEDPEVQLAEIRDYLTIDQLPEDTLSSLSDNRLDGSCSWLTRRTEFQEWQYSDVPRYFRLEGPPACGKSILATHVIEHLKDSPTCYYFFKNGEKVAPSFSGFLRSMAYQMAKANAVVREALYKLSKQGPRLDIRSHKSIWHNVFIGCVFHEKFQRPHFWIIDALDEAVDGGPLDEYFMLMSKIDTNIPLKVLITSRRSISMNNLFTPLPTITVHIKPEDTLKDIRRYVETRSATLPFNDSRQRNELVQRIVDKSGGNFLWVVLVMKQLHEVNTVEEIREVLDDVPQEMNDLYSRNIHKMETSKSKQLAKHIITWAICAVHPLTIDQMKDAIKLSLGTTLARDLRTNLESLCGQFLQVDKHSRILVVHETARAFLTNDKLESEFRIDARTGHHMIAKACLQYLLSEDLKYSRRRRSAVTDATRIIKTSIADYACLWFSDHISKASSSSHDLFETLLKFFKTNVLSWIECVTYLKNLDCLIRTSRHLLNYLGRRSKHVPLIPGDLNSWAIDLPRIVTQFGNNLLKDPQAIHTLVPPFCPRNSAVYRQFGSADDGIRLMGAWNAGWDDRVCSLSFDDFDATAVASLDQRFAVGLSNGVIKVYRTSTCEEKVTLAHGEPISILEFGATSKLIASAGLKLVKLWNAETGEQVFGVPFKSQALAMAFTEDEALLVIASRDKRISLLHTSNGQIKTTLPWTDTVIDVKDPGIPRTPHAVRISIEQQVMAVVYRGKPVQLWSLEHERPIGACIRQPDQKHNNAGHNINSAVLNPVAEIQRLAVAYWDDVLIVFDTDTCKPVVTASASLDKLAVAPNGKTLAGSDGTGSIKLYDFETLQLLHRIQIQGYPATALCFTSDSLRIIDVRSIQANVWEPSVLVSQDVDSNESEPSESVLHAMDESAAAEVDESATITALHCCEEIGLALCGRSDGRVDVCNLDDPENTMRNLYRHRGSFTSITAIDWTSNSNISVTADSSGHFRVMQITKRETGELGAQLLAEKQLEQGASIHQVLVNHEGTLILVSSPHSDSVWSVSSKKQVALLRGQKHSTWKWFRRPSDPSQLVLFKDNVLQLFNWNNLRQLTLSEGSLLSIGRHELKGHIDTDSVSITSQTEDVVFAHKMPLSQRSLLTPGIVTTRLYVFDLSHLEPLNIARRGSITHTSTKSVADIPNVETIIGTVHKFNYYHLVFITRSGWVCSVELSGLSDTFQKHFFIPSVWRTGNSLFVAKVLRNQNIVFVHNDGIIVVKNGLDIGEHVTLF